MDRTVLLFAIVGCAGHFLYRKWRQRSNTTLPLPPGPKPLPIIGNFKDLPPRGMPEFQHWLKHKDAYGSISSITVMGLTLVFLHDRQVAHDLLDKKSIKSSGRPTTEFAYNMCGFGDYLACQQYGSSFRLGRKFMHQELGSRETVSQFNGVQEAEVGRFLLRILDQPEALMKHIRTKAGAIILKIAYGYTIKPTGQDPLVELIGHMMTNFSLATVPMTWMVDCIPALKYLPDWFPGTAFKATARQWLKVTKATVDIPHLFVKRQMSEGTFGKSYVSNLIQRHCDNAHNEGDKTTHVTTSAEHEHIIKYTAATLYGGASDTIVSSMSCFVLAMVMFPEVQSKAQREIEQVIGLGRLPTLEDRDKLPYVDGVVKEALRWYPAAPLGFPHVTSEDIIYNNYFIPRGAFLIPAVWWFCHDPQVYAKPDEFDPERYFEPRNEPDPKSVVYGFGRRICPGRHLADSTLFLAIAQMLTVFAISKAEDAEGKQQGATLTPTPGIISHPKDFPYRIEPREEHQEQLIKNIRTKYSLQSVEESISGQDPEIVQELLQGRSLSLNSLGNQLKASPGDK